jgi:hypothetical protein
MYLMHLALIAWIACTMTGLAYHERSAAMTYANTTRIGSAETIKSIDAARAKVAGKTQLLLAAGQRFNCPTIQPSSETYIGRFGVSTAPAPIIATSGQGVLIKPGVKSVTVIGITFDTAQEIYSAVDVAGIDCRVSDISQIGAGRLLTISGAQGLLAERITCTNGELLDKGFYSGGAVANRGCQIRLFKVVCAKGEHGGRFHNAEGLTLGDEKLSLQGMPGVAGYIRHTSAYQGAALIMKSGAGNKLIRLTIDGPLGFGPTVAPDSMKQSGWEKTALLDQQVLSCDITTPRYVEIGAAVRNIKFKGGVIRATKLACLDLKSAWGPSNQWAAPTGSFEGVTFRGPTLYSATSRGQLRNFEFTSCTFEGRPIGINGEVK